MPDLRLQRVVLNDRYQIKGRINSGSYAEVFVARDRDSGHVVVIKALNTHLQGTPDPGLEQTRNRPCPDRAIIQPSLFSAMVLN